MAYLVPYKALALMDGQDRPESASTTAGVSLLGAKTRFWRWRRGTFGLVLRIHSPALSFDIFLGTVRRVIASVGLFRGRRRLMTLDGRRRGIGMMTVILVVFGAGIVVVLVIIIIIVLILVVLITATAVRDTIIAVLVVILNLFVTSPGRGRRSTTQGTMTKERSVWGWAWNVQAGHDERVFFFSS